MTMMMMKTMSKTPIKQPSGGASTPHYGGEEIPMQAMKHGKSRVPATSFGKEFTLLLIERAKEIIKVPPQSGLGKLGPTGFGKKPGNKTKIVLFGLKGGKTPLFKFKKPLHQKQNLRLLKVMKK